MVLRSYLLPSVLSMALILLSFLKSDRRRDTITTWFLSPQAESVLPMELGMGGEVRSAGIVDEVWGRKLSRPRF